MTLSKVEFLERETKSPIVHRTPKGRVASVREGKRAALRLGEGLYWVTNAKGDRVEFVVGS